MDKGTSSNVGFTYSLKNFLFTTDLLPVLPLMQPHFHLFEYEYSLSLSTQLRPPEMASCAALKVLSDRVEHVTYHGNSNFSYKATRPAASKIRLPVVARLPKRPAGPSHGVQCASRRSKPQSAIADLYFAEELQACLGHRCCAPGAGPAKTCQGKGSE